MASEQHGPKPFLSLAVLLSLTALRSRHHTFTRILLYAASPQVLGRKTCQVPRRLGTYVNLSHLALRVRY